MNKKLAAELERLASNAALRREDLLLTALRKSARRRVLTVAAGLLALTSAGAITTVIAHLFGHTMIQLLAALSAAVSGTVSLFITAYYSEDTVMAMLLGAAKYLALRENVYRLIIHPKIPDSVRFQRLSELQVEYAHLDETYSRYFSVRRAVSTHEPPMSKQNREITMLAAEARHRERENVRREIEKHEPFTDQ